MSLMIANAARLKPEIRLEQAVFQFESSLSANQRKVFHIYRLQSVNKPPGINDVMQFTAEVDRRMLSKAGGRCFGPRFTNFLQGVQQFAAIGDVVVGGSQNLVACGVWSLVRMSLLSIVNSSAYLDSISHVFMEIGRTAPRHQAIALLYPRSQTLRSNLLEYFIIVVQLCLYIHTLGHKSTIQRLAATNNDSGIKGFQTMLDRWAKSIKEDVGVLVASRIEEEASSNSRFRDVLIQFSKTASHQKNLVAKLRFLDQCSTYDYQTSWKQIRKKGSTNLFTQMPEYKNWKEVHEGLPRQTNLTTNTPFISRTIVFVEKLGFGKSVMMANMIDDLNWYAKDKEITVAYFFCRQDISESCKARTVIGALLRQIIQPLPVLPNSKRWNEFFWFMGDLLSLVAELGPIQRELFVIIDGLDLCDESERLEIIKSLREFQNHFRMLLAMSYRSEPGVGLRSTFSDIVINDLVSLPDNKPDIEAFIEAELECSIQRDDLVFHDPMLVLEIHDALLKGSEGMFLWVALQLQSLRTMQTDQEIRDALLDLPKDLPEIYDRILKRHLGIGKSRQRQILEITVAAKPPLTRAEMQEALSVVPGDTEWSPSKVLNDIYSVLKSCGCLLVVDEEETTVRFVHPSVEQYLLSGYSNHEKNDITIEEAQSKLAEIIVTYLSYGVFGSELSTIRVPEMKTEGLPSHIMTSTMTKSAKVLALNLLRSRRRPDFDAAQILMETLGSHRRVKLPVFHFFHYAKSHALQHIIGIEAPSSVLLKLVPPLFEKRMIGSTNDMELFDPVYQAVRDSDVGKALRLIDSLGWNHIRTISSRLLCAAVDSDSETTFSVIQKHLTRLGSPMYRPFSLEIPLLEISVLDYAVLTGRHHLIEDNEIFFSELPDDHLFYRSRSLAYAIRWRHNSFIERVLGLTVAENNWMKRARNTLLGTLIATRNTDALRLVLEANHPHIRLLRWEKERLLSQSWVRDIDEILALAIGSEIIATASNAISNTKGNISS